MRNFTESYSFTGKTTLLKHIANRELEIPSHMSVLHVEQEVRWLHNKSILFTPSLD